ncbi:hypothetical protein QYE76_041650 [Lolium multiflorum]|uniref:Uncharacterized protein n=1 Tax=Lolium multiflorum TaxID=4521 RepID=A0AAD8TFA5_LOLMU|nr:hypothetical protein QYE76_041650 [Lolium multiflorum]
MQWPIVTRLRLHLGPTFAGPTRQPLRLGSLSVRIGIWQWISTRRGIFGISARPGIKASPRAKKTLAASLPRPHLAPRSPRPPPPRSAVPRPRPAPTHAPFSSPAAASSRGASTHQLHQSLASSSRLELYPQVEARASEAAAADGSACTREQRSNGNRQRLGRAGAPPLIFFRSRSILAGSCPPPPVTGTSSSHPPLYRWPMGEAREGVGWSLLSACSGTSRETTTRWRGGSCCSPACGAPSSSRRTASAGAATRGSPHPAGSVLEGEQARIDRLSSLLFVPPILGKPQTLSPSLPLCMYPLI